MSEILVSRGDGQDSLSQHSPLIVHDEQRVARIVEGVVDRVEQTDLVIHLTQERQAAVAGDVPALKIGDELTAINTGEKQGLRGTVCHADGLSILP